MDNSLKNHCNNYWIDNKNNLSWETNFPDTSLIHWLNSLDVLPKTSLDIGCGSGINSIYMSKIGIKVVGVDIAREAISIAQQKSKDSNVLIDFYEYNIFENNWNYNQFDFIFDRGCFHNYNSIEDQKNFVYSISKLLKKDGQWLSIIGSTEAVHIEKNPPKRSLCEIVTAIEPHLEILKINSTYYKTNLHNIPNHSIKTDNGNYKAWAVLSKNRGNV